MHILAIGLDGAYPASGYGGLFHGGHVRALSVARGLAQAGHTVNLLGQTAGATAMPGLYRATAVQASNVRGYDAVVVIGIAGWQRLRTMPALRASVEQHPRVAIIVDSVYGGEDGHEALAFARVLAVTGSRSAAWYAQANPAQRVLYMPWCCPPDIPPMPSPWPDERPRVLFAGIVHDRYVDVLNDLVRRGAYEVWVAGLFLCDGGWRGLNQTQRDALLAPAVRLATDALPGGDPDKQGPVDYQAVCRFAQHASVGLNLTPAPDFERMGVSCKVYDYAAAGLPVVSEPNPASDGDVVALGAGVVVPWGDADAIHEALLATIHAPHDRDALRRHALVRFSWAQQARLLAACLEGA